MMVGNSPRQPATAGPPLGFPNGGTMLSSSQPLPSPSPATMDIDQEQHPRRVPTLVQLCQRGEHLARGINDHRGTAVAGFNEAVALEHHKVDGFGGNQRFGHVT